MNELEERLAMLNLPENQGDALDRAGFALLAGLTLVLPILMLMIGLVIPA